MQRWRSGSLDRPLLAVPLTRRRAPRHLNLPPSGKLEKRGAAEAARADGGEAVLRAQQQAEAKAAQLQDLVHTFKDSFRALHAEAVQAREKAAAEAQRAQAEAEAAKARLEADAEAMAKAFKKRARQTEVEIEKARRRRFRACPRPFARLLASLAVALRSHLSPPSCADARLFPLSVSTLVVLCS